MKRRILSLGALLLLSGCGTIGQAAPSSVPETSVQSLPAPTQPASAQPTQQPTREAVRTEASAMQSGPVPTEPAQTEGAAEPIPAQQQPAEPMPAEPAEQRYTQAVQPPTDPPVPAPADGMDTRPPVLIGDGTLRLETGTPFDPDSQLCFGDDTDTQPRLEWAGSPDTTQPGTYPLAVTLTDAAGNTAQYTVTVQVQDSFPASSGDPVAFGDFAARHGGEGRLVGIDVSKWQGDIDFAAVRDAGCSFVIMRIGYASGGFATDEYYAQNMERARAAGLRVGVYFNANGITDAQTARDAADWVAGQLSGPVDLPVGFDWESFSSFRSSGMNLTDLGNLYHTFAEELSGYGLTAMLYSSRAHLTTAWPPDTAFVWLAEYGDAPGYDGSFLLWQGSDCGRIPGIGGAVDLDVWYTDSVS